MEQEKLITEFKYDLIDHLGVVAEVGRYTLELNEISFNGNPARYDLRRWDNGYTKRKMQKGVSMNRKEIKALKDLLNTLNI